MHIVKPPTIDPVDVPAVINHGHIEMDWTVRREGGSDKLSQWSCEPRLILRSDVDGEERHPIPVGQIVAYFAETGDDADIVDEFDALDGDLPEIARTLLEGGHGLLDREALVTDENNWDYGLLIVDSVKFEPTVRGRGLLPVVLADLAFHCRGVGIVALRSHAWDETGDMPVKAGVAAQRRLAAHYGRMGFRKVPKSDGIMVADPADLRKLAPEPKQRRTPAQP